MTAMDPKYYADNLEGSACPNCCSEDIIGHTPNVLDSEITRPIECEDCGATWDETFSLTGYDNLIVPEGAPTVFDDPIVRSLRRQRQPDNPEGKET